MQGAITSMPETAHKYGHKFKAWAWNGGSIFVNPIISKHATFQEAVAHLREIGVEDIIDETGRRCQYV